MKRTETRKTLLVALAIALIAAGAFIMLPSAIAVDGQSPQNPPIPGPRAPQRLMWLRQVLKNGQPENLTGTASLLKGNILVLQTTQGAVNLVLPRGWVVGSQGVPTPGLFDGDPFTLGQTQLSITVLRHDWKTQNITVRTYLAYRIAGNNTVASALMPFNIVGP